MSCHGLEGLNELLVILEKKIMFNEDEADLTKVEPMIVFLKVSDKVLTQWGSIILTSQIEHAVG